MTRRRGLRSLGPWLVLLSLVGLWLGHTLEDLRVRGTAGLGEELAEPGWMLPLGALLALLAAIAGARLWWLWLRLCHRLDAARLRMRAVWRNREPEATPPPGADQVPSLSAGIAALWAPLALLQLAFLVAQENLEAIADGGRAPGLRPLIGAHWAAPLVHAAVALGLAAIAATVARHLRRRRDAVRRLEALVSRCARRVRLVAPGPPAPRSLARPPLAVHGSVLWCRPPPLQAAH